MHCPNGARIGVGRLVANYADRHYWQEHSERLPDFRIKPGALDLGHYDVIAFAQNLQPLRSDFTQDSQRQAWSWKRLALHYFLSHSEAAAAFAGFIFDQLFQRLEPFGIHLLAQPPHHTTPPHHLSP